MESLSKDEILSRLTLFNEKVDEINNSNFITNWESQDILWDVLTSEEPWKNIYPNEEEVKAFILTWRFLYQKLDKISIAQLSDIYSSDIINRKYYNEFQTYRNSLNIYLDLNFRSSQITNRQILKAFIFGNYSHSSKENKKLYLELTCNESKLRLNYASFYSIMNNYIRIANLIKELNQRCIQELS